MRGQKTDLSFGSYAYSRPDINNLTEQFEHLLQSFQTASSASAQLDIFKEMNSLREEFDSMLNIMHIRHTNNTYDEFYVKENDFFDENLPLYEALRNKMYKALLASEYVAELEQKLGAQLFRIAEMTVKTFDPAILEEMQEENKLSSQYTKLKAAARITFQGQRYNLSSLYVQETNPDRKVRKSATTAKWAYFRKKAPQIETIFDELVKLRHSMAVKLGYKNYVELGYARMGRSDYNPAMVANFRKQVEEHIVPIASWLYKRQQKRLEINKLKIYDEEYRFASGNAKPQGEPNWIVDNASSMYKALSPETDEFFQFMRSRDLMDLVTRDGKATGGYCTYINKYQSPYIFSNFNGTSADIDVLTHEAGHAFQVYMSRDFDLTEYHWPTFEACEIHSMSMEFFTWPWMNLFFGNDTDKYKFSHLASAIQFIPYGVAVDEFQHVVYENPDMTPAERNEAWSNIEKKYMPHRDYGGHRFLEGGGYWQKQNHIFHTPFYYIDYTLAQICAFQFWQKDRENHQTAWDDYVRLCKAGGSRSFLELVALADLRSPFDDGCIASVVGNIKNWLANIDDSSF